MRIPQWMSVAFYTTSAFTALACVFVYARGRKLWYGYVNLVVARNAEQERERKQAREAVASVNELRYPFCAVPFSSFCRHGGMHMHEELRDANELRFFDTWQLASDFAQVNSVVFVSHQWLSHSHPDPDGEQYRCIVEAVNAIRRDKLRWAEEREIYIWLDYCCIPQLNESIKGSAIQSLVAYVSVCKHFLVCAPDAVHRDTQMVCNAESYLNRGWCRLEQWACIATGGLSHMFLYRRARLEPLASNGPWRANAIEVYSGNFTQEEDKQLLTDIVLGLWGLLLLGRDSLGMISMVNAEKARVFPREYFGTRVETLEQEISKLKTGMEGDQTRFTGTEDQTFSEIRELHRDLVAIRSIRTERRLQTGATRRNFSDSAAKSVASEERSLDRFGRRLSLVLTGAASVVGSLMASSEPSARSGSPTSGEASSTSIRESRPGCNSQMSTSVLGPHSRRPSLVTRTHRTSITPINASAIDGESELHSCLREVAIEMSCQSCEDQKYRISEERSGTFESSSEEDVRAEALRTQGSQANVRSDDSMVSDRI